jgi:hypothetical protein
LVIEVGRPPEVVRDRRDAFTIIAYCRNLLWQHGEMPKKRKLKPFPVVKAVKSAARENIGMPPAARVVPDKKKRTVEKHKPTLGKMLGEA